MCGRTCLTLDPNQIVSACKYKSPSNDSHTNRNSPKKGITEPEFKTPEWRSEFNCGRKYTPSHNIAPTDITPVLVCGSHFCDDELESGASRVVVPMMWGTIPYWHKGDYRKHGLSTNNCRLENLSRSKLYQRPFQRGQRCVILCEGFYEWQTTKMAKPSERAAFFLHMPQWNGVNIYDNSTWNVDNINLLKMAGLFDIWQDDNGDKMYSYSVITLESSKAMSWLHHRMPAILETAEQVNDWLNYKDIKADKALSLLLHSNAELKWYRVSNLVNNSRNKSDQCNKPVDCTIKGVAKSPSITKKNTILQWLKVPNRNTGMDLKHSSEDNKIEETEYNQSKRQKLS